MAAHGHREFVPGPRAEKAAVAGGRRRGVDFAAVEGSQSGRGSVGATEGRDSAIGVTEADGKGTDGACAARAGRVDDRRGREDYRSGRGDRAGPDPACAPEAEKAAVGAAGKSEPMSCREREQ